MRRSSASGETQSTRSEMLARFPVDACIPRLYIAHGLMPHNKTRARMFRFGFPVIFLALAIAVSIPAWPRGLAAGFCVARATVLAPWHGRSAASAPVRSGIDVLEAENFAPLRGLRVGVITNQTGVDSQGVRTIDALAHAPDVKLMAIFSPEHGLAGRADADVANDTDAATGLPIYSLYGETRRPSDATLAGLDALVFDIQDAGVRFYTFTTTMAYCMEAAAKHRIAFFVLDRPNPIGGETIEGPMLDADKTSFVGYFPMPVRYAMTIGELAEMFNAENKIGADLQVIAMKGWRRSDAYDATGLRWTAPSPNLRTVKAAFLYPGVEILQAGGVSVGRGTDAPFEILGAPWIQAEALATELNRQKIPGVLFAPAHFTPASGLYALQACQGVTLAITDWSALRSMTMGLEIAETLGRMYPDEFHTAKLIELLGSQSTVDQLLRGDPAAQIVSSWSAELDRFRAMRAKYLLYN